MKKYYLLFLFILVFHVSVIAQDRVFWCITKSDISSAKTDGTDIKQSVTLSTGFTYDIESDFYKNTIYWSEGYMLRKANIDGTGVQTLFTTTELIGGLALDLTNEKLYYITYDANFHVNQCNLDGTDRKMIYEIPMSAIKNFSLSISPTLQKLYWTTRRYTETKVMRSNLDGSSVETLMTVSNYIPYLAIDEKNQKLYLSYKDDNKVMMTDMTCSTTPTLVFDNSNQTFSMAVNNVENKLYFAELNTNKIRKCNLDGSSPQDVITTGPGLLYAITFPTVPPGPTVSANQDYTFALKDFLLTGVDKDLLTKVQITSMPDKGTIYLDTNGNNIFDAGEAVVLNQEISKVNINAGKLKYKPVTNESGLPCTTFSFKWYNGSTYSVSEYQQKIYVLGVPNITTQAVSDINSTTATGNGNITNLGVPYPTAYGICWNTTGNPTDTDSKVDMRSASATGAFTASMTGLAENTTYHVRAFATNTVSTVYGDEVSFTTLYKLRVSSVSVPLNRKYKSGDILSFTVNFNDIVNVTTSGGTPYIPITLDEGVTVKANYIGGSGTTSLLFSYTVATGDLDTDGVTVGPAITANGGTLKNADGVNASLTLNNIGSTSGVLIDAVSPTIYSVTSDNSNGVYRESHAVFIKVKFTEILTVTGTPTLALNSGGTASYFSGNYTPNLTFMYTIGSNQSSADLDYSTTSSLTLAGGTIQDAAGNSASLTLPAVGGPNSLAGQKDIAIAMIPAVETKDAVSIASTTTTLKGTVNANNASSTVTFDYGLTTGYGNSIFATESPVTGNTVTNVSISLTGLLPNTTYHYRVRASNFAGTSNGSDLTFTTLPAANSTFTGIGNWSDVARWSAGIPGTITATTIDGICTANSNTEVASLKINSGKLTINPDRTLKVTGSLVNNAGADALLLKSDGTGTGKLVNNSTGVSATVQQYFVKGQWHYYTLPTSAPVNVYPLFYRFWAVKCSDSFGAGFWKFMNSDDVLTPGIGYGAHYNGSFANDTVVSISGSLNTGDITVNTSDEDRKFFLIGNPYSCTVDWTTGINRDRVENAFYLWNPVSGSYSSYVDGTYINGQTQYIAPMQGFFISAINSTSSVTFTNAAKTTTPSYFRSADLNQLVRLSVKDQPGMSDETVIRIKDGSTTAFDGEMDAYKIISAESFVPQLWSNYNGNEYSINTVPDINENLLIPLKVLPRNTGIHEISLSELKDYDKNLPVYIYDENLERGVNVVNGSYSFTAEAGKIVNLYISFTQNPTALDNVTGLETRIFSKDKVLSIVGMSGKGNNVKIFNVDGKMVKQDYVVGSKLDVPVTSDGLYIVRIVSDNGKLFTGKVVVK
jgi:hypothetical protein